MNRKINDLIDRSSLGTPGAKEIRARVHGPDCKDCGFVNCICDDNPDLPVDDDWLGDDLCKRSKCHKTVAYPGAVFCGAGCCARYECGDR